MTTVEEALEQGWLEPAPAFFGGRTEDALTYFGKCRFSPWVLIRRTDPKPVPDEGHPLVRELRRREEEAGREVSQEILDSLPRITPRPRPLTLIWAGDGHLPLRVREQIGVGA